MEPSNPSSADLLERKQILVPYVLKYSENGLTLRQIAVRLGVSKSTVNSWRREARRPPTNGELTCRRILRLKWVYRELIEAWQRSQADKQVSLVERVGLGDGDNDEAAKNRHAIRNPPRTAEVIYLAKAVEVQKAIDQLEQRLFEIRRRETVRVAGRNVPLTDLTPEDTGKITKEDRQLMTDAEIRALHDWMGTVGKLLDSEPDPDPEPTPQEPAMPPAEGPATPDLEDIRAILQGKHRHAGSNGE